MSRQEHVEAVSAAQTKMTELQTILGLAQEKVDEATVSVNDAIGDTQNGSALHALEKLVGIRNSIPELLGNLEAAAQEMREYGGVI
jgi:hypothetical protein